MIATGTRQLNQPKLVVVETQVDHNKIHPNFILFYFLYFIVVQNGLYTIHSWDVPYPQENGSLNYCWRSRDGKLALRAFCQIFVVRMPALFEKVKGGKDTVSFESVCLPGYFVRQKNYHFILEKRDGSQLFGESVCYT